MREATPEQLHDIMVLTKKSMVLSVAPEGLALLAKFCCVFGDEAIPGDHDSTMRMVGRREAFFHVWKFMELEPHELVGLYRKIQGVKT